MIDKEKVIKELHDARRYLENKEWSDRGASPHIDAINDALVLLKEQGAVEPVLDIDTLTCDNCNHPLEHDHLVAKNVLYHERYNYCPYCGKMVKWND